MRAALKSLDLNSIDFSEFLPEDLNHFGFWVCANIGPAGEASAEIFQVFFCNRAWLECEGKCSKVSRYLELNGPYDPDQARTHLERSIDACSGTTWVDVVAQLSMFSEWEFENYRDG